MAEAFPGVIGIDLGTTFSCVAVLLHDTVHVIPNDQGNRTTPSRVGFVGGQTLVGDAAMNASLRYPTQIIFDAKRMIGRKWGDADVERDRAVWPFRVEQQKGGDRTGIEVVVDPNVSAPGEEGTDDERWPIKRLPPEQISATLLRYLKTCAERHLGKSVTRAVITVPAYFNDAQRERTRACGQIAGLEVLRIVNEPTAAALAYGLDKKPALAADTPADGGAAAPVDEARNILVFDFGGGTFDVSIITVDNGAFLVVGTAGHTHLGGQDIDALIVKHLMADIKKRHGVDVSDRPKLIAKLRVQAEKAKKSLSHATEFTIECDGLLDGGDYEVTLTRAKVEEVCAPIFKQCMDIVQKAITDVKMQRTEINDIVMVGGSSRIPKLRKIVSDYFGGKALNCTMNPDEAIAVGAAIQAAILSQDSGQQSDRLRDVVLMDVVPLSLGVDVDNGRFDALIPRNHTIPHKVTKEFSTFENNQTEVTICVYEGERPLTKHNRLLGEFDLEGITKAKKGVASIFVTFDVDANGILTVTAEERLPAKKGAGAGAAGPTKSLTVKNTERLSTEDINAMVADAEQSHADDAAIRKMLDLLSQYEGRLDEASDGLSKVRTFRVFHRKGGPKLLANIDKALAWLHGPAKSLPPASVEARQGKLDKLARKAEKLFRRCEADPTEMKSKKKNARGEDDDEDDDEGDDDAAAADEGSGTDADSDEGSDGSADDAPKQKRKKHRTEKP
jgi:heat shock protein 1/8